MAATSTFSRCLFFHALVCAIAAQSTSCTTYTKSLPIALSSHQAAYAPTKDAVYLFGGDGNNLVYKWDLSASDSWFQPLGSTPTTPFYSDFSNNAVLVDGIVYFVGMRDGSSSSSYTSMSSIVIHRFHLNSETWSDLDITSSTPVARSSGCLSTNNTHLFLVDGFRSSSLTHYAEIYIYEIATNTWTAEITIESLPTVYGWRSQFCSLVDDTLYMFGGKIAYSESDPSNGVIYTMNVSSLNVSTADSTILRRNGMAVHHEELIYLIGCSEGYEDILAYDYADDSFFSGFILSTSIDHAAVVILDSKIWIFGGYPVGSDSATTIVQTCDLPTSSATTDQPKSNAMLVLTLFAFSVAAIAICGCIYFWRQSRAKQDTIEHISSKSEQVEVDSEVEQERVQPAHGQEEKQQKHGQEREVAEEEQKESDIAAAPHSNEDVMVEGQMDGNAEEVEMEDMYVKEQETNEIPIGTAESPR